MTGRSLDPIDASLPALGPSPPEPAGTAWPAPRRSHVLAGTLAAMVTVGVAAGAYMLWHPPLAPDPDGGSRCARAFDAPLRTARGGSDADLVRLGGAALAARCGRQALGAFEAVGGEADEATAWTLARFYDPHETDPVFRAPAAAGPVRAAAIYLFWSTRAPRQAAALERLCATDRPALDADPALRRACAR